MVLAVIFYLGHVKPFHDDDDDDDDTSRVSALSVYQQDFDFQHLYINILDYCDFNSDHSTFLKIKIKKFGKTKSVKNAFLHKNKNVYGRLLLLWFYMRMNFTAVMICYLLFFTLVSK